MCDYTKITPQIPLVQRVTSIKTLHILHQSLETVTGRPKRWRGEFEDFCSVFHRYFINSMSTYNHHHNFLDSKISTSMVQQMQPSSTRGSQCKMSLWGMLGRGHHHHGAFYLYHAFEEEGEEKHHRTTQRMEKMSGRTLTCFHRGKQ